MTPSPPDNPPEERSEPELPAWARQQRVKSPMSDERMAVFIGPKWGTVYRRKFGPFLEDPSFVPTWNWAAALFTPIWFLYRKLYLPFILFWFAPLAAISYLGGNTAPTLQNINQTEQLQGMMVSLGFELSARVAAGGTANWLLVRRARAATTFVATQQLPDDEARELLGKLGRVHRGPTILLVVLVATGTLLQLLSVFGG